MTDEIKLKPCPFCGRKPKIDKLNSRASGWISCSDRFPEVREKVLALYDYCTCEVRQQYIMIASLAPDGYWMEGCTWHPHQSVTHWMPIPELPKGESK